jgi:predicted  nucleic acid-binding Zn-ribbon protein
MEDPDNIVLVYLRRIDEKVDRALDELHDIKVRATAIEEGQVGLNRRLDRLEHRVDRIERRLDLSGDNPSSLT